MVLIAKVRNAIARTVATPEAREEVQQTICPHDEDDRLSAARMGHPFAFICKRCGYREDC